MSKTGSNKLRRAITVPGPLDVDSEPGTPLVWVESSRCLRGSALNGKAAPGGDKRQHRKSRPQTPVQLLSKKRERSLERFGGLECDEKYQAELREVWERELGADASTQSIKRRQMSQFFSFLRSSDADGLLSGAGRYIPKALRDFDFESDFHGIEFENSRTSDFDPRQGHMLRAVLRGYAQVSRPLGRGPLTADTMASDRLYRPTFCRFLIDSRLASRRVDGHLVYYQVVRYFDSIARAQRNGDGGKGPTLGALRSASIEQCMRIISLVLGNSEHSTQEVWDYFETGLPEAYKVVQALLQQCRERTEMATKLAAATQEEAGKPAASLRPFGSPPPMFTGSMKDWSKGLRNWIQTLELQGVPEAIARRIEQQFALESYLSDILVEPGVIHVSAMYSGVFRAIFDAYFDERRSSQDDHGNRSAPVPHMSFAAFFRFCVDLSVFPLLCSFDEARAAYKSAESLVEIPLPEECDDLTEGHSGSLGEPSLFETPAVRPRVSFLDVEAIAHADDEKAHKARDAARRPAKDSSTSDKGGSAAAGSTSGSGPQDSSTESMARKGSQVLSEAPTPRVKSYIDLSWIRERFETMSSDRKRAYALLKAIDDLVADRFLSVRGLFLHAGVGGDLGEVSAGDVLQVLMEMHVGHGYDSASMQEFIKIVNPHSEEGVMETCDLEKAVTTVGEDFRTRNLEPASGRVGKQIGLSLLGDEARRSDGEDLRGRVPVSHSPFAFGHAAFMECVLRLGMNHMHGSGVAIQAAVPGGAKGLWLIAFLHYQLEKLTDRAPLPVDPRLTPVATPKSMFSSSDSSRPGSRGILTAVSRSVEPWPIMGRATGAPLALVSGGSSRPGTANKETDTEVPVERPPEGARYVSCLTRLLDSHPDPSALFKLAPTGCGIHNSSAIADTSRAFELCTVCQRRRNRHGVGCVFCHVCSGVDQADLSQSLLYPVLQRRQLKKGMRSPFSNSATAPLQRDSDPSMSPLPLEHVLGGPGSLEQSQATPMVTPLSKMSSPHPSFPRGTPSGLAVERPRSAVRHPTSGGKRRNSVGRSLSSV